MKDETLVIFGRRTVEEYLKNSKPEDLVKLFLNKANNPETNKKFILLAKEKKTSFAILENDAFHKKADTEHHQGVLLIIKKKTLDERELFSNIEKNNPSIILILDHIEDPANFGSILRTCGFYGVNTIIIPKDRAVKITPSVEKISSGVLSYINVYEVTNLNKVIKSLKEKGYWAVATGIFEDSVTLSSFSFPEKTILVIGNEHKGISRLTKDLCDYSVSIKSYGKIDSLNVAVATAIFLDRFFNSSQKDEKS